MNFVLETEKSVIEASHTIAAIGNQESHWTLALASMIAATGEPLAEMSVGQLLHLVKVVGGFKAAGGEKTRLQAKKSKKAAKN